MEIKGILKNRTNSQSGTSQRTGQQWRTDEWLVVIPGQYEKKINFEVRGVERCKQWEDFFNGMPDKNAPVMIKFEINAREHEGRYFNSVEAWDIAITTW
jgi:hypothetical protein